MAPIKTILHITPFFSPNIGGVETHLDDLVKELSKLNYRNIVLTYSPLTAKKTWIKHEKLHNIDIYRFNWIGHNLFHKLEKYPLINFLYITPYLLIRSILWILTNHQNIDVIHSHGINAALIGNILKKIFNINKHVTSIYSTYDNVPLNSLSTNMLVSILNTTDKILTQSDQSISQLTRLGVTGDKITRYFHWIDLDRFVPIPKITKNFSILFVGRMVPQKNAYLLAKIAKLFPLITFNFIGTGPDHIKIQSLNCKNIKLIGDVDYSVLQQYYQQNNLLCIPSKYAEGWGRVIMESIACGTPVISTNLGATVEAANDSVAIFINPTKQNLIAAINKITKDQLLYQKLKSFCRPYSLKHYSSKNIKYIIKNY